MDRIDKIMLEANSVKGRKVLRTVNKVAEFINSSLLPKMQREAAKRGYPLKTAEIINEAKKSVFKDKVETVGTLLAFSGRKMTLNRQKFLDWFDGTDEGKVLIEREQSSNGSFMMKADQEEW